ncbi:MAG: hypothetical protein V4722_17725 [Bacteroidota bacterium]
MKKILKILGDHERALIAIGLLFCLILFLMYKYNKVEKSGWVTVAKVIKNQGLDSGGDLYLDIQFRGKVYGAIVNYMCVDCIGKFFFVKINGYDPTKYPIFYPDSPVPDCILKQYSIFNGWDSIPVCKK